MISGFDKIIITKARDDVNNYFQILAEILHKQNQQLIRKVYLVSVFVVLLYLPQENIFCVYRFLIYKEEKYEKTEFL